MAVEISAKTVEFVAAARPAAARSDRRHDALGGAVMASIAATHARDKRRRTKAEHHDNHIDHCAGFRDNAEQPSPLSRSRPIKSRKPLLISVSAPAAMIRGVLLVKPPIGGFGQPW